MASSSNANANNEMDQLKALHRSGILSVAEFASMATEINKSNTQRLDELPVTKEDSDGSFDPFDPFDVDDEMLVDEDGDLLLSGHVSALSEPAASLHGSFDDEHDEDLVDEDLVDKDLEPPTTPMTTPREGTIIAQVTLAAQAEVDNFSVGTDILVKRNGRWAGKVVALGGSGVATFLTAGRVQVSYEYKQRKGRGFTCTTQTAWVSPSDLERRVVSPRNSPKHSQEVRPASTEASTGGEPPTSAAARPHSHTGGAEQGPKLASHERGRKLAQHGGADTKGGLLGKRKTPESNVPTAQRLKEFPNQSLIENKGGERPIFCRCCKTGIRNHKGTINTHVKSPTHEAKLKVWLNKLSTQDDVKEFLSDYFRNHPTEKYATLDESTLLWRFDVMETFLGAGLAPSKIDALAGLLKGSVPGSQEMRCFIPKVELFEMKRLRKEFEGQKVTVIFDGTTRLGEAIAILLRWCPKDFSGIQQRLVTFATTEKHMDGLELCAFINRMLTKACEVEPWDVVGGARDSCSTNGTAMRNLKLVMLNLQDFLCVSHTLSKLGEHINLPTLEDFMTHWLGLVQHHPSAKKLWQEQTGGTAMKGYSTIRWCSREEVQNELAVKLGTHVSAYVDTLMERDIGDAHPKKMRAILDSHMDTLQNELALSLDLERIIKAVYRLEADTLVILLAYDEINALLIFGDTVGDTPHSLPNLAALLRGKITIQKNTKVYEYFEQIGWFEGKVTKVSSAGAANPNFTILYSDGKSIVQTEREVRQWLDVRDLPEWQRLGAEAKAGFQYLRSRLDGTCNNINFDCSEVWKVLALVKFFDPSFAAGNLTQAATADLTGIKPLRNMGDKLLQELPAYLAATQGFTVDHHDTKAFTEAVLGWWANNGTKFPTWAEAAQTVFSFTPNSAAAERVFSLLKLIFGDLRDRALADMMQATLMLMYNKRVSGHAE